MFHKTIADWVCDTFVTGMCCLKSGGIELLTAYLTSDALTVGELSFHYGGARWGPSERCPRIIAVPHSNDLQLSQGARCRERYPDGRSIV